MADVITERVRVLLGDHIHSVVQLETLLLLHQHPDQAFAAEELARELRIDGAWAAPQLAELCARGLLARTDADPPHYRYGPQTAELQAAIDELAQAYAQRRVTITSLIFSKPAPPPPPAPPTKTTSPLRSFADAFRLRRDPGSNGRAEPDRSDG